MINRIKQVFNEADYVLEGRYWLLEQEGGGEDDDDDDDDDDGDEGDEGDDGEYDPPPWMSPTAGDSHAYHFPRWAMPPSGDPSTWPDHPMYHAYEEFNIWLDSLGGGLGGFIGLGGILDFPNFMSLMRFLLRPHVPNTVFSRFPWLRELFPQWMSDELMNVLRDILRQWMMENLDFGYEILVDMFPWIFKPMRDPSLDPVGTVGSGGLVTKPETMTPWWYNVYTDVSDVLDFVFDDDDGEEEGEEGEEVDEVDEVDPLAGHHGNYTGIGIGQIVVP